jgi:hypothetical protein
MARAMKNGKRAKSGLIGFSIRLIPAYSAPPEGFFAKRTHFAEFSETVQTSHAQ